MLCIYGFVSTSFTNRDESMDSSRHKAYYASPSSRETYRDRRLTTNFELWVEIFCVPTCFHMRIPKPCLSVCLSVRLSVCTPSEEVTIASSILVLHWKLIYERKCLHEYYSMEIQKIELFQKSSKFEFWLVTKTCTYMMT